MENPTDSNDGRRSTLIGYPVVTPRSDPTSRWRGGARPPGPGDAGWERGPTPPLEALDFRQVFLLLRQNLWRILAVTGLVFAAAMVWTFFSSMQFESTGRLYLGEIDDTRRASTGQELDVSGQTPSNLGSEMAIIKSRSLVTHAILESGLNAIIQPPDWEAPTYLEWRISRRNVELLDSGLREVRAVHVSGDQDHNGPEEFTIRFLDEREYQLLSGHTVLGIGRLGEPLVAGGVELTLVAGFDSTPQQGSEYELLVLPVDDVVDAALARLDVSTPTSTTSNSEPVKVVTLTFAHDSPRMAATFLRELMRAYLQERQSWKAEEATAAEAFMTTQLSNTRKVIDELQRRLTAYRSENPIVVLDNDAQAMISQIAKYEEQRVASKLEVAALQDVKRALSAPDPPVEAYMMGEARDTVLMGMADALSTARQRLTELHARFNERSPDIKEQEAQVEAQLSAIRNYVDNRLTRARENLGTISGIIGQFQEKLKSFPSAEAALTQLNREAEVYSSVYSYLLRRQQETALQKASTISKNRILDDAQVPHREYSPVLSLRLISIPLGVLLGAMLVLFRKMTAQTLQAEGDVRRVLGRFPIFAHVPPRTLGRRGERKTATFDILGGGLNFDYVEAFRLLRTNLYHHTASADGGRVVLVTSAFPGDGKTTCTLSLAAVLAADGKSVLVIDSDLRKQSHSRLLGNSVGEDLRSVLAGASDWRDVARPVVVSTGEFHSIDAGGGAPAELLSSERMLRFLGEAKRTYDFVLLDSPSYPLVSDALVLATAADCVLSVVRLDHTPQKLAVEHVARLSRTAPSYALVVNDAQAHSLSYGTEYTRTPQAAPGVTLSSWR